MKRCGACGETKPRTEFYSEGKSKNPCKDCSRRRARQNRQQLKARNPEEYRRQNRDANLRSKYGITEADYRELSQVQGHVCAVCGEPETARAKDGTVRRLAVDHHHQTGQIRALLCNTCNVMVGMSFDNPSVLRRAAEYLEEFTP